MNVSKENLSQEIKQKRIDAWLSAIRTTIPDITVEKANHGIINYLRTTKGQINIGGEMYD